MICREDASGPWVDPVDIIRVSLVFLGEIPLLDTNTLVPLNWSERLIMCIFCVFDILYWYLDLETVLTLLFFKHEQVLICICDWSFSIAPPGAGLV